MKMANPALPFPASAGLNQMGCSKIRSASAVPRQQWQLDIDRSDAMCLATVVVDVRLTQVHAMSADLEPELRVLRTSAPLH